MLIAIASCSSKNKQSKAKKQNPTEIAKESQVANETPATEEAEKPADNKPVQPAIKTEKKEKVKPVFTAKLPQVPREFRAAWIATVANINWPSKNNLTTEQQKAEAIRLLDILKENNFNAVIFQVRPSADALYKSTYEPWSYFLTGEIGKAPSPYYDPLEFWVAEAHKRGLELHVWLNPYRAHHSNGGSVTSESMVRKASDHVVRLKNGMYWFDPSSQKTQDHAAAVVRDIVKRYDIDGVHFDDYFYPYATYNGGSDFPDDATWNAYRNTGGKLSRADFRRDNVNKFIKRVYSEIKAEKPFVKFGLSPFGIWKPGYPAGVTGSSQYDELYADAKLWLNEGWIDYFTPQLYWPIDPPKQSFTSLLKWWQSENTHNRHLWPGLNTVEVRSANRIEEIKRQIQVTREVVPNSVGAVHWSIAGLTKNPSMLRALHEGPYNQRALVPASPWLAHNPILKPTLLLTKQSSSVFAKWLHKQPEQVFKWVAYARYGDTWKVEILDGPQTEISFPKTKDGQKLNAIAVKPIDRLGNEGDYIGENIED
ncbi:family 10 glycosylhydrolase [Sphingobacterium sp. DK4209]|uniref:Family 10 glycosylhydrolase n=2 Tax=Sphingobacterium zhuxiongii TaxID=2662364 RepID=A0A5Q0QIN8_9SPHI|nr:family 10 glycosylhydrolase [Sphingobacterium sp. DK4209]QGA28148.1 family 10 glycosylhydrolase [Sphingobacterium sp. dk4302]